MSTATKQRGISFSGPMVTAIAAGNKTRTRRTMKPQPVTTYGFPKGEAIFEFGEDLKRHDGERSCVCAKVNLHLYSPYRIGEVLYVKEALENIGGWVAYAADSQCALDEDADCVPWKWKRNRLPGIYMPKRFARYWVEITGIRVERLQAITHEDAIAEGFGDIGAEEQCWPTKAFAELWDVLNGEGSFDANPWVWVYEFRKVSR